MFRKTFFIISALVLVGLVQSCDFHTAKKIRNPKERYIKAVEYYNAGKYLRTQVLLENTVLSLRMTKEGEDALFKYADSYYHTKDYILAGYYFKKYTEDFPQGIHAEEAAFMTALCYYLESPRYKLDQTSTLKALDAFELFITKYPQSEKIADCNKYTDLLRHRLELKAYKNAKLYYDMEYYNAATVAFANTLKDYPDSKYREETFYYILLSNYKYAKHSITSKQPERYRKAAVAFEDFAERYPESRYLKHAKQVNQQIQKNIQ